ncbi:hypothetical protein DFH27DRAFT_488132 [Peziza echinospora]|nr:hypothetical protein DFH27DRAFT_488132 [Peziza echinospora]
MRSISAPFLVGIVVALSSVAAGDRGYPRTPEISHLFVDFDGTIAVTEAFENLAEAAYVSNVDPSPALPPWSYFSEAYNEDYDAFTATYPPRTNLSDELIYRSSPGLRAVESDSFDRAFSAGVFTNATLPVLQKYASEVQLRDGFWEFVDASLKRGIVVRVLSLNWSVGWIRLVLREDLKKKASNGTSIQYFKKGLSEKVAIYCAEALPTGVVPAAGVKGGKVEGVKLDNPTRLHTGGDKVDLMRKIISFDRGKSEKWKRGGNFAPRQDKLVVFIGDSSNDLPPLVEAEAGIIAGDDSGTLGRLAKFGVNVTDLAKSGYVGKTNKKGRGKEGGLTIGFLYRLRSFEEVVDAFWR